MNIKALLVGTICCLPWWAVGQRINCDSPIAIDCGVLNASGGLSAGSQTIFCEGQLVEFINNTDINQGVDSTIYCWGDGTVTRVAGTRGASHTYDFPDDTCVTTPIIPINIRMIVIRRCAGNFSLHSITTPIAIRLKPLARFGFTSPVCSNQPITFRNLSCQNTNNPVFTWDFGNGERSSQREVTYTYPQPGTYTVKLSVQNECATTDESRILNVLAPPRVRAVARLSRVDPCFDPASPLVINFTNRSEFINQQSWEITGGRFQYLNSTDPLSQNPVVQFNEPATYRIKLTGQGCGQATWDTTIVIAAKPAVTLQQVESNCKNITVVPANLVKYAGGEPTSIEWTFLNTTPNRSTEKAPNAPLNYTQFGQYGIRIRVSNTCGSASDSTLFAIDSIRPVRITAVPNRCNTDPPLNLTVNLSGGSWSGPGVDSRGAFNPAAAVIGDNRIVYQVGTGECLSRGEVNITVGAAPKATLRQISSSCQPITLRPNELVVYSGGAGEVFDWRFEGANTLTYSTQLPSETITYTDYREYKIRLQVSNNCGVSVDSTLFSIDSLAKITVKPVDPLCLSDAAIPLQATPLGGRWSGPGVTNGSTFLPDAAQPGSNTLRYTVGSGNCQTSAVLEVVVRGARIQAGPALQICNNSAPVLLTGATPLGGVWRGPGISDSLGGRLDPRLLPVGLYQLQYVVRSADSACLSSGTRSLEILGLPQATLDSLRTVCAGAAVQFNSNASTNTSVEWFFGDGAGSTAANPTHTYAAKGSYPLQLIVRTAAGCTDTARSIIQVAAPVKAAFSLSTNTGCAELVVNINNQSSGDNPAFEWYLGPDLYSTATNPEPLRLNPINQDSNYVLRLRIASGCNDQDLSQTIFVKARPNVQFAPQRDAYCSGETVIFGHKSLADSLIWDFGNGKIYRGFDPPNQVYSTGPENDTIKIQVRGFNECGTIVETRELVIRPTDARAFFTVPDSVICLGEALCLESFSRPKGSQLEWQFGDGNTDSGERICHTFAGTGRYTIRLTARSCGQDQIETTVRVIDSLPISLNFTPEACIGQAVPFQINTPGSNHRIYYTAQDSSDSKVSQYRFANSGLYTVRAWVRSNAGCISRTQALMNVLPPPIADFRVVDSVCVGGLVSLVNQSIRNSACRWDFGGVRKDGCNPVHRFTEPGAFPITLIVQDRLGCLDTLQRTAVVRPTPVARFDFTGTNECSPVAIAFNNRSSTATSYKWYSGDGQESESYNANFRYRAGGDYNVLLVASQDGICFDSIAQVVSINGTPQVALDLEDRRCRPEDEAALLLRGYFPNYLTTLYRGDTLVGGGGNRFPVQKAGMYRVMVETTAGCDTSLQYQLPEKQFLLAKIMPDTTIKLGQSVKIRTAINRGDAELSWLPTQYLDLPDANEPISTPLKSVRYVLTVKTKDCLLQDSINIRVLADKSLFFPNAFSPNNDNHNDFYQFFPGYGVKEIHEFKVFDRYGVLVFQASDYLKNPSPDKWWNGYYKGVPAQPGVYAYFAQVEYIDGIMEIRKGDFTLVR